MALEGQNKDVEAREGETAKPITPEEFIERFDEIQASLRAVRDRFTETAEEYLTTDERAANARVAGRLVANLTGVEDVQSALDSVIAGLRADAANRVGPDSVKYHGQTEPPPDGYMRTSVKYGSGHWLGRM